jgi:hypothetical protein
MKRKTRWAALGAVLLLTCATTVWSQQDGTLAPADAKKKPPAGTITGVIAGTDLTGGGTTGTVTLNLDTTKVPQLGTANTFAASQSVNGDVSATGTVTGGVVNATTSFDIGGTPFAFGSYGNSNAFLGFAGNAYTTAIFNTASGFRALYSNTTGSGNTASGISALASNTTGYNNTAIGNGALSANDTGWWNTASGISALASNTAGYYNTASGFRALQSNSTGNFNTASGTIALFNNYTGTLLTCVGSYCDTSVDGLTNATAIGAYAVVGQSNALVLGSINGVNSATASVNVGIGTTTPSNVFTIGQGAGHAVADGWDTYSSRRLKTNIHTLHGALATVEQLRGVSYDLKANGKHEVGVIAEEVGAVVPEVVSWDQNGKDAQSVDYGRLTALLIEATKEQQALIREQQEQIRAQQTQLSKLTSELGTIQVLLKSTRRGDERVRTVKAERTVDQ